MPDKESASGNDPRAARAAADPFPATRWSLVLAAQEGAEKAWDDLCRLYWYPLYAYARRRGLSPEDAEDRTQDLFQSLIRQGSLRKVAAEHGRLRAFFLAAMQRHVANEWRRSGTAKRGGGMEFVSIEAGESRLASEPQHHLSPDVLFDQSWAWAVLDATLARLREWYAGLGRGELFDALRGHLAGRDDAPGYSEIATRLGSSEGAVRSAVFQMRQRYRRVIEQHITDTVASADQAKDELGHLCRILAGRFEAV